MPLNIRAVCFVLTILLVLPLCFSNQSFGKESDSLQTSESVEVPTLDQALDVLSGYHKDKQQILRSMEMTDAILRADPDNVEALNFLSRVWLTHGYILEPTKEGRIRSFQIGKETAERAIELAPDNPDSHFFYVSNLALIGQVKGVLNSLFMLPEIRKELDLILELDPNHSYGLAMQGALYYYLPSLLGGDMKMSEIYIRRSLLYDPHLSSARLYLGMNLTKQEKYDEAIAELLFLINDKDPVFFPDWYLNRKYAIALLKHVNKEKQKVRKDSLR